ncbi:MAG: hypothetical protein GXP23_07650 [Gammaproteobacteria bacterium]|nr:hypothetical protein [Gammaproteobacteria bacterium]
MKIFELIVLFCFITSGIAAGILALAGGDIKATYLSGFLAMWVTFVGWFAYSAALLSFIVVAAVSVAKLYSGSARAFVKGRMLTVINFSFSIVVLVYLIYESKV